jgi:ATP-dependent DNA ligase
VFLQFQPMPLLKRRLPFDDPDFIFESNGTFRALAVIEHGRTHLVSRNGHRFFPFADLEKLISTGLRDTRAVIDGEICSLDKRGRAQFKNLLFHRGNYPCLLAFDLLMRDGKDCRRECLLDRKQELRRLLNRCESDSRIQYVDYVDGTGIPLFEQVFNPTSKNIRYDCESPDRLNAEKNHYSNTERKKRSRLSGSVGKSISSRSLSRLPLKLSPRK